MVATPPTYHLSLPIRTHDEEQVVGDILREFELLDGLENIQTRITDNNQKVLHILVEPLIEDGPYTIAPSQNISTYEYTEGEYALEQVIKYVENTITEYYGTHLTKGIQPPHSKQWEQAYQSLHTIQTTIGKNSGCVSIWIE